jgi:pyruvate dehydrogenase E2 component (dihydrolipoamide acetyltransferase)
MAELSMPSLGADMEDGTLVEWRIRPGDAVQRGDVVAEVETAKGVIEIEVWQDGVVEELRVRPGAKVPVGAVLATIAGSGAAGASRSEAAAPAAAPSAPPVPAVTPPSARAVPGPPAPRLAAAALAALPGAAAAASAEPATAAPSAAAAASALDVAPTSIGGGGTEPTVEVTRPPAAAPSRPAASPSARRLARELGLELGQVRGSGPHGAITREDVLRTHEQRSKGGIEAAAAATREAPAPSTPQPRAPARPEATVAMRKAIAAAMSRSKREIPHYYLAHEMDVSRCSAWLEAENQRRAASDRLLLAALLLKATALAARRFESMNGYHVDGEFQPKQPVHIGVAIALRQGGLVAPAIHDVDRSSLDEVMRRLADLVQRARAGRLRSSELSDATLTVTSLGDRGTDSVFGVIYPPQVALVGFGTPRLKPWAESGMLGIRPAVTVTLAADHRVSDGHTGARFLDAIARHLHEPEKL